MNLLFSLLFLVLIFVKSSYNYEINKLIEKCTTKQGGKGFCREEKECVGFNVEFHEEGCSNNLICCPRREVSKKKCEEYSKAVFGKVSKTMAGDLMQSDSCGIIATPLIVGGERVLPTEFPHMAALGYVMKDGKTGWLCGGSLISESFILTAAHCISRTDDYMKPKIIRLGSVNLGVSVDHEKIQNVSKIIFYPGFDRRRRQLLYGDVALIKMSEAVKFTSLIRPICLDYKGEMAETQAIASGYGVTELQVHPQDHLLKVTLDIIDKKTCELRWKRTYKTGLLDSQLCAGSMEGGRDTCEGDSGGPLQTIMTKPYCMYRQIALTSTGGACGYRNSANIYSRVFSFLPWIESVVWPGED